MSNSSRNNKLHVLTEADVRAVKTGLEKSKARPPTTLRNRDRSIRPHPDRIFFKVSEEDDVLPAMSGDTPGEAVCDYWILNDDGDFEELRYASGELSQLTIKSSLPNDVTRASGIWTASRAALGYYWVEGRGGSGGEATIQGPILSFASGDAVVGVEASSSLSLVGTSVTVKDLSECIFDVPEDELIGVWVWANRQHHHGGYDWVAFNRCCV